MSPILYPVWLLALTPLLLMAIVIAFVFSVGIIVWAAACAMCHWCRKEP